MMKVAAVFSLALLLLCCSVSTSADPQGGCDCYAATNGSVTMQLHYTLTGGEHLRWKHGKSIIFSRKPSKLDQGKETDVHENGSLKLMNVDHRKAGTYTPEVFLDGKAKGNLKNITLCVLDPVQKPQVKIQCLSSSITFTCSVNQPVQDLRFEWFQNDNLLKVTSQTLPVKTSKEVEQDAVSCQVSNRVSSQKSPPVTQNCTQAGSAFPTQLFGVNIWIFVGGGGGVVLMLITVIIVCCIRNRRKRRMRVKDEEELRLGWTHPDQHHHHHHQQQQPAGHTGPRQHRPKKQLSQQSPRDPAHPSSDPQPSARKPSQGSRPVAKNGEHPPPLPQPRKKPARSARV